jgi:6-phosphogluconolactonase (cycloisomerase 2 family)
MKLTRRQSLRLAGAALLAGPAVPRAMAAPGGVADRGFLAQKVFTIGNAAGGNEVLVFGASADAMLAPLASVPTHGLGSGGGLGSQGAVTLSGDGRFLFAVNAGSDTVSTFAVQRHGLALRSVVPSGGLRPISTTEQGGIVYVLNAGGAGNIAGFHNAGGMLVPIPDAVRPLSAAGGTDPAQVGFDADGEVLVVTEKATNRLTTYRVRGNGRPGQPMPHASAGLTPFGFAFSRDNVLVVSEAFGGAAGVSAVSSYRFDATAPAMPSTVSASVATTQTAACWVAITPDGLFAYVTNTGSGTVSSYRIMASGAIALTAAAAATTGAGSAPADAAIPARGGSLHVLNGGSDTIASFRVAADGSLAPSGTVALPATAVGLAAN